MKHIYKFNLIKDVGTKILGDLIVTRHENGKLAQAALVKLKIMRLFFLLYVYNRDSERWMNKVK